MGFKQRDLNSFATDAPFLRGSQGVEYTDGNVVFDQSEAASESEVLKAGTAIYFDDTTNTYKKVKAETLEIKGGALVANDTVIYNDENVLVPAIRKASVIEARTHGVTDAFKEAVKSRIDFDI